MSDVLKRIAELRALEAAATKGPWAKACHGQEKAIGGDRWWTVNRAIDTGKLIEVLQGRQVCRVMTSTGDDAALIAAARNALPDLLAIAEAADTFYRQWDRDMNDEDPGPLRAALDAFARKT